MKVRVEMTGLCRICGEPARTATPDGGGVSSLCWDCTRIVNAERLVPYEPRDPAVRKAERDELVATYLHTTWGDVLPNVGSSAQVPTIRHTDKPKRKRKAAR